MNICPKCDYVSEPGLNFCGNCGHGFAISDRTGRERRQVTVLFSDIVNFTRYTETIDDDDVPEILEIYQGLVKAAVSKQNGYIAQFLGDGVMAYFGYPTAMENATERAIRAGLDIISAIKSVSSGEHELQVRVGIHHGSGIITNVSGEGRLLVGNTPNIAARMQTIAEPNTLVISEPTFQATRGLFECRDLGEKEIKGISNRQSVFRVTSHKDVRRFDIERQKGVGLLAGRKKELSFLEDKFRQVVAGSAHCALITGDAGIGKSRLLYEFEEKTKGKATWLAHRCSAYRQGSALLPIKSLLRQIIGLLEREEREERREKIKKFLTSLGIRDEQSREVLYKFLFADSQEEDSYSDRIEGLLKKITHSALQKKPLILVLEDAHWVDQSTLELLKELKEDSESKQFMLIVTARPVLDQNRLSGIDVSTIKLAKMTEEELTLVIRDRLDNRIIRSEVPKFVISKADGNPLFVQELTNTLLDTGVIIEKNGQIQLDPDRDFQIPGTLNDTLSARVDQLGQARHIAQVAAVIGREFNVEVLNEVLYNQQNTLEDLAHLEAMDIIVTVSEANGERLCMFRHDLIRDAIYDSMVRQQRETVHRNVAYTLETIFKDSGANSPELLAKHWEHADEPVLAIEYYQQAGSQFAEIAAHREAMTNCRSALVLVRQQPQSLRRDRTELDLLLTLGASMNSVDGYASQEKHSDVLIPALKLCERLNVGLEGFPIQYGIWSHQLGTASKDGTIAWKERLEETIRKNPSAPDHMRLSSLFAAGTTNFWQAKFDTAVNLYDEIIEHYEPTNHSLFMRVYGEDPGLYARLYRQWAYLFRGEVDLALLETAQTSRFAANLDDPLAEVMTLAFNLHITRDLGLVEETLRIATELISKSEAGGYPYYFAVGFSFRDWCFSRMGRHEETFVSSSVSVGETFGIMSSAILRDYAEVLLDQGDAAKALELINEAEMLARKNLDCLFLPDILRVKAVTLNALKKREEAVSNFKEALNTSSQWGERYWAVKVAASQFDSVGDLVTNAVDTVSTSLGRVESLGDCKVYNHAQSLISQTA
ncbi:MAG: AAA family ATPase [Pseudomonadales bacterium]|nr:AAA family ATPase [Pseudomonadales bacterium]